MGSFLYPEISEGLSLFETTETDLIQNKESRAVGFLDDDNVYLPIGWFMLEI